MLHRFATALSFLTVFRLPLSDGASFSPPDLARSFSCFPLVGLLLGACTFAAAAALRPVVPPLLLAAFLVTAMAALTRGLHHDGLADLFDGFWGGYTPERRLEIMRDSRIGSFGVLSLVFAALLKTAAVYSLLSAAHLLPLLVVPVLSRAGMAAAAFRSRYARSSGGMAKPFLEHMTRAELVTASIIALAAAVLFTPRAAVLLVPAAAAVAAFVRRLSYRRIGGVTGDVLGATNEIGEVVLYSLAACCYTP